MKLSVNFSFVEIFLKFVHTLFSLIYRKNSDLKLTKIEYNLVQYFLTLFSLEKGHVNCQKTMKRVTGNFFFIFFFASSFSNEQIVYEYELSFDF